MFNSVVLTSALAFATALFIAFALTPVVKSFAFKIGAIDVPKDDRRMHKTPIPRVGGLAIYLGFLVSILIFGEINADMKSILLGSVIIVLLGVVDDVVALSPKVKFAGQIAAALLPILSDVRISVLTNPFIEGEYFHLGWLSYPITLLWIVGLTNAVNFIDGLDGLAGGNTHGNAGADAGEHCNTCADGEQTSTHTCYLRNSVVLCGFVGRPRVTQWPPKRSRASA